MDGDQRIKISGWRKKQQTLNLNFDDPASFRPLAMGKHPNLLWPHATRQGWMTKHMPPAFSFTKTRHRRYVLLVDRLIYTFKTDTPKHDFREFFELTQNTNIFVTDQFPSVLYCLEIQRMEDGRTWYLQAEDANDMKRWMDRLKRTIQWLRLEDVSSSDSASSYCDNNNSNDRKRFSAYSYHTPPPPPPQHPPPSGPPPPIPAAYHYSAERQISVEHMTTSAAAAASAALVSPTAANTRRPSRLPDVLPPQLPPPTCTLPSPPPPMR
ncbi:hypothetical protein BDB00DRAFT_760502 [Zychaea mexicana]|uniref:uncharacterized protein n=1 Tax=Zychaea mexicana TaxID=64656 RepID=UPI0022FEDCFC|nr:uncharacterized protein BDB00DRAFT_760502 [Zychaea mexicana]KAI9495235.1 hypothetical protein BDB00DRAFT_760502 [Zychaea mexicana]